VGALFVFTVDDFVDANKCTLIFYGAVQSRTIARDGSHPPHWATPLLVNSFTYLATAKYVKTWRPWRTQEKETNPKQIFNVTMQVNSIRFSHHQSIMPSTISG